MTLHNQVEENITENFLLNHLWTLFNWTAGKNFGFDMFVREKHYFNFELILIFFACVAVKWVVSRHPSVNLLQVNSLN